MNKVSVTLLTWGISCRTHELILVHVKAVHYSDIGIISNHIKHKQPCLTIS